MAVGSNLPVLPDEYCVGWVREKTGRVQPCSLNRTRVGCRTPLQGGCCPAVPAVSAARQLQCCLAACKSLGCVGLGSASPAVPHTQPAAKRVYYSACRCQVSSAPP